MSAGALVALDAWIAWAVRRKHASGQALVDLEASSAAEAAHRQELEMVEHGSHKSVVLVHGLAFAATGSWQPLVDWERREKEVDSSSFHPTTSYHCYESSVKDDQGILATQKVIPCEIAPANDWDLEDTSELDVPCSEGQPFVAGPNDIDPYGPSFAA